MSSGTLFDVIRSTGCSVWSLEQFGLCMKTCLSVNQVLYRIQSRKTFRYIFARASSDREWKGGIVVKLL